MNVAIAVKDPQVVSLCKAALIAMQGCHLCWCANNAKEANTKAALNTPNLILMDLEIACASVAAIMKDHTCAILVLTASVSGSSNEVFKVMGQGALDVVKMDFTETQDSVERLHNKMVMVQLLIGTEQKAKKRDKPPIQKLVSKQYPPLVVIGASTGGPTALARLLNSFPDEFPYAFVVVQHVDVTFAGGLAEWLQKKTGLPVETARSGCRPQIGKVLLAAADDHLIMNRNHQLYYTPYPLEKSYRPSVDVFFESVATHWPESSVAVILTGMGTDGAQGLKQLADAGWHTIVQQEASCVVYGMPKAAVEAGAVAEILDIDDIGPAIQSRRASSC